MTKQYDLIIIGAGIAGRAFACAVAQQGLKIALLDQRPLSSEINDELDLRMSAINKASQKLFEQLDVWQSIKASRTSQYNKMHVWDGEGSVTFDSASAGQSYLGHIIENQVMAAALAQQIEATANIDFISSVKALAVYPFEDSVQLLLDDQSRLEAKLLVGADGANSWLRKEVGIEIKSKSYQQVATVAVIKTELPHQQTAWQHFTAQGPLAFLPLEDEHLCSIVWSQGIFRAKKLERGNGEEFIKELEKDFENRLGKLELVSERQCFPLTMRHAQSYTAKRVALLGDAIHTIHPLAGLGLNLGLKDVADLSELIAGCVKSDEDFGNDKLLAAYQRARKKENLSVLAAMGFFKEFFSNDNDLLRIIRNEGFKLVDRFDFLKGFICHAADLS